MFNAPAASLRSMLSLFAVVLSSAACADSTMMPVSRDAQTFDQFAPRDASSTDVAQDGTALPDVATDTGLPAADAGNCPMVVGDDGTGLFPSTCNCIPNTTRACSLGPRLVAGVGACRRGVQRCLGSGEVGRWSDTCEGGVAPTAERCDNMIDDDCDGMTDEDCGCMVGATMSCYSGPAGTMGVGACRSGTRTCVAGTPAMYGACTGDVVPRAEVCGNGVDDDCDGEVDDPALCGPGPGDLLLYCQRRIPYTDNMYLPYAVCISELNAARATCNADPRCVLSGSVISGWPGIPTGVGGTQACVDGGRGMTGLRQWTCRPPGSSSGWAPI
jgi:hypothetical protein